MLEMEILLCLVIWQWIVVLCRIGLIGNRTKQRPKNASGDDEHRTDKIVAIISVLVVLIVTVVLLW